MAALIAVIALLLLAPSAGASDLRPAPRSTGSGTFTDGGRYAIHMSEDGLRILSDARGEARTLAVPEGCGFPGMGAGTLAFLCRTDQSLRLYDLGTAAWSAALPAPAHYFGPDGIPSLTVGRAWIRADGYSYCNHCGSYVDHFRRDTGAPGPADPEVARVHADLDDERLWVPLCAPLRRPRNPTFDGYEEYVRHVEPRIVGRRMVALLSGYNEDRVILQRCGSRRRTVIARTPAAQGIRLGDRFVTWVEGRDAVAYEIATGRVRRWRVPGPANRSVFVSSTRRRVFVDKLDSRGVASRRFVAKLP